MRSWVRRQIARVVAVLSVGAFSPGCLIAPPDPLEEPQRIPPRALVESADPLVTQIVQSSSTGAQTEFRVKFVSDDLGEFVIGRLFVNYPNGGPPLGFAQLVPGTSDSVRTMSIAWTQRREIPVGCYTVTLTITHAENYSREDYKPIDNDKTAFVTWWVAHDIEPQSVNLDECSSDATAL